MSEKLATVRPVRGRVVRVALLLVGPTLGPIALRARGYETVTVSELLAAAD